jgi:peroxiredoxin
LKAAAELKAKGIAEVIVYCVNDGAVMTAWAKQQGIAGSMLTFLADPTGKFTRKVGMVMKHPGPFSVLGNRRCKRFVLVVDKGEVKVVKVSEAEDDPAGDADAEGPVTKETLVETILPLIE